MGRTRRCTRARVACLLVLAACSGSGGAADDSSPSSLDDTEVETVDSSPENGSATSSVEATEVATTAEAATTTPTTAAPTTTTEPPVPMVPPGVQFGAEELLPPETSRYGASTARDGVLYLPASYVVDDFHLLYGPGVVTRQPDGTSSFQVIDDNKNLATPPGFPFVRSVSISSMASSPLGIVAVGGGSMWENSGFTAGTVQSLIWFSADGTSWQRIDPRDATGARPLQLSDVAATPNGFVATGTIADSYSSDAKTGVVVLESADGLTWRALNTINATWSLDSGSVDMVGGEIVVTGVEYACTADAGHFLTFSTGAQFRIWHSADDGATWRTITGPDTGLVTEPEPAPTDPAACPPTGPDFLEQTNTRFTSTPSNAAITEHGVVVLEAGTDRIGVSSDLDTWTIGPLEHRLATPRGETDTPDAARQVNVFQQGDDLVVAALEPIRDEENEQVFSDGEQMYTWRSADGGTTWVEQLRGRPLLLPDVASVSIVPIGDHATAVLALADLGKPEKFAHVSVAGELEEYSVCTAAPKANCSFASAFAASPAGSNLTEIDLRGATIGSDVDLGGANLTGANLNGATIGAALGGANLTFASLVGTELRDADLAGTTLSAANLTGARVNASVLHAADIATATLDDASIEIQSGESLAGADLSGLKLSGVRFSSYGTGFAPFAGAIFAGTDLRGASFYNVDLTGVDFSTAVLSTDIGQDVSFGSSICPDGAPSVEGVYDRTACRL